MLRLDKYLCDMKAGTRSQVKALIRKGQVTVNGLPVKSPEMKIEENSDQVCVNGKSISYARHVYFMLNKPAGCVSATQDNHDKTVLQLMREQKGAFDDALLQRELFPVGRLDKDTEGLLLITDDGELAHRLLSPAAHVEKTYYVEIDGPLTDAQQNSLQEGVDIGEKKPDPSRHTERNAGAVFSPCRCRIRMAADNYGRKIPPGKTYDAGGGEKCGLSETAPYGNAASG